MKRTACLSTALLFLLNPLSGHCQLVFNRVPRAVEVTTASLGGPSNPEVPAPANTKVVRGVVQDAQGVLVGATVWLRGTRAIAVTDENGEFELRVPATAKTVSINYGYGGLEDETVTLAPAASLGSLYLLRPQHAVPVHSAKN